MVIEMEFTWLREEFLKNTTTQYKVLNQSVSGILFSSNLFLVIPSLGLYGFFLIYFDF